MAAGPLEPVPTTRRRAGRRWSRLQPATPAQTGHRGARKTRPQSRCPPSRGCSPRSQSTRHQLGYLRVRPRTKTKNKGGDGDCCRSPNVAVNPSRYSCPHPPSRTHVYTQPPPWPRMPFLEQIVVDSLQEETRTPTQLKKGSYLVPLRLGCQRQHPPALPQH